MNSTELNIIALRIKAAIHAEDIFGKLEGTKVEKRHALGMVFREMAKVVHPDRYALDIDDHELAQNAFKKLSEMKEVAENCIENGSYGQPGMNPGAAISFPKVIEVGKRHYTLKGWQASGDIASVYHGYFEDAGKQDIAFKVADHASDNDLMKNEADILKELYPASEAEDKYYRFLPRLLDTFMLKGSKGSQRRVNVLPLFSDSNHYYSLAHVRQVHSDGLDFRDVVWIYKRVLSALGFIHRQGFVHGALVPPNILVDAVGHGARIIDWCFAVPVKGKETVKAVSKNYGALYAPEILKKEKPSPASDIFMAANIALELIGDQRRVTPEPVIQFLESCRATDPRRRPNDAWHLYDEFDQLLVRLVGKPRYRKLAMPA